MRNQLGVGVVEPWAQEVSPTVTSKWAKGSGGPAGDEVHNLVVTATVDQVAHTLKGEGHDASEDGTGRGTPVVFAINPNTTPKVSEDGVAFTLTQPSPSGGGHPQCVAVVDKQTGSVSEDVAPTLKTDLAHQMGPVVAPPQKIFAIQDPARDKNQNGLGIGEDVMFTLASSEVHGVAFPLDLRNAGRDPEKLDEVNRQGTGTGEDGDPAPTLSSAFVPGVVAHCADVAPTVAAGPPFSRTGNERVEADALVVGTYSTPAIGDIREDDVASTLSANSGGGGETQNPAFAVTAFVQNSRSEVRDLGDRVGALAAEPGAQQQNYILQLRPRRLTPRECERLQGFPDDYTAIRLPPKGKQTIGKLAADGPRYKALGNSMAVPVMHWLGRRIQLVETTQEVL